MKCEKCGQNEVNFHYSAQIDGESREIHLCLRCAGEIGFDVPGVSGFTATWPLKAAWQAKDKTVSDACPVCGRTAAQIMESGRVGCSRCYEHHAAPLEGSLRRLYGSARHKGRLPRSASEALRSRRHMEDLNARLRDAVAREDYEQAAILRDRIRAGGEGA